MHRPTIIMMGSAGSGKGTQSSLIEEQLGYHVVEAGQVFRETAKLDTPIGRQVKEINDSGGHASDELITQLVADYIKNVPVQEPLLIDGYPRTIGQAEMLKGLLTDAGRDPEDVKALWINVPREEAERRLLNRSQCTVCKTVYMSREMETCLHCGGEVKARDYDQPESIKRRLDFFYEKTMPAIDMYREQGKLIEVNGGKEVAHVFEDIKRQL